MNVTCAINSVPKPRTSSILSHVPINTKSSASETPVTISGFDIGIFVTDITRLRVRFFILLMPSAAVVPSKVATTLEATARIRVFSKSPIRLEFVNSSLYH